MLLVLLIGVCQGEQGAALRLNAGRGGQGANLAQPGAGLHYF